MLFCLIMHFHIIAAGFKPIVIIHTFNKINYHAIA